MLAETLVTQCNPCYSAVSASLTNPLPDRSNYSPFCHTHYFILRIINTSLLQCFTAESSRELMSSEEYRSALRKLSNKQRQMAMFLLLSKYPNSLFSPLSAQFLNPLSFLISPSLSTIPSFSGSILCPPKIKTSSFIQLVYLVKRLSKGPVLYRALVFSVS